MAQAFINRGAIDLINWGTSVTAEHTDLARERLLEKLLRGEMSLAAVMPTMKKVGPDQHVRCTPPSVSLSAGPRRASHRSS